MTLNPDWGTRWCIGVGLIGVGSSRDSDAREFLIDGNSVVLTDGDAAAEPEGVGCVGDLGGGGLPSSITGGLFSTEGTTMVGGRLGVVRPVITGETVSLAVVTMSSEATVDAGLGRANP